MPEPRTRAERLWPTTAEVGAAVAGMCLFGLFAHRRPLVLLSFGGLLLTAGAVVVFMTRASSPATMLGLSRPGRGAWGYAAIGALLGVGLGVAYRAKIGNEAFPGAVRWFAVMAVAIGAGEELLYRGYVQGRVRRFGAVGAVLVAALAHTAYKCLLFALPPAGEAVDLRFLAVYTFVGGLVFGALRERSRSVLPPLVAHVLFDLIVYGDHPQAPWWVWS